MKRNLILPVFFLIMTVFLPVLADDGVLVDYKARYVCGDTFELSLPEPPATSSQVTNAGTIQAEANSDDTLMQVRVRMRNLTHAVLKGMGKDSFQLTGYVRDRSLSYTPEVIIHTDYFSAANFYTWDQLPPLRMADVLLIFRVNPVLINWELLIDLDADTNVSYEMANVSYQPKSGLRPCKALFQFDRIQNLETKKITYYEREK